MRPVGGGRGAALALLLAGCSDAGTVKPDTTPRPRLTVAAASSLRDALTSCASQFTPGRLRLRFGAPDRLAALLPHGAAARRAGRRGRGGARSTRAPGTARAARGVRRGRLVLAVPKDGGGDVGEVADLAKPDATVAIGAAAGAVGASTRQVLRRLPAAEARAIPPTCGRRRRIRPGSSHGCSRGRPRPASRYRSDVEAAEGVQAIELPGQLQPAVLYAAGVVKGTGQPAIAQAFVDDLREGNCHDALLTAGFGEPP